MGRRGLLIGLIIAGFGLGDAHAFPAEHLKAARAALRAGDVRAARDAIAAAHEAFSSFEGVAANDVLATYWVYSGLLAHQRKKADATMDAFRQALVVDRRFELDKELVDDRELRKMFEALRGEVEGRDVVSPKVPKEMGCAQAYVDGSRVRAGDWVGIGERLAQVQCPHGDVHGLWMVFEDEAIDWIEMCPYPVDTSIDVYAAENPEDTLESMAPSFEEEAAVVLNPCLDIMALPPPVVSTPSPDTQASKSARSGPSMFGADSWNTPRMVTVGAGGALIVTGVVLHFAVVVPAYNMVEWGRRNPTGLSRYQADILTTRFRDRRMGSWAVTGTGVVTAAVGLFVLRPKATTIQPWVTPGGVGLAGRF